MPLAVSGAGCGSGSGTLPAVATPTPALTGGNNPGAATGSDGVAQTVGAGGGTLATPSGRVQIAFPAGALAADRNITVQAAPAPPDEGVLRGTAYEFGPDGSDFGAIPEQMPRVTVRYDPASLPPGAREEHLALYRHRNGQYERAPLCEVDPDANTVTASLFGFSRYVVRAANPFVGHYEGTYRGGSSGSWTMGVAEDGTIEAETPNGFRGTGKLNFQGGVGSLPLNGTGTFSGFRITFAGTFTRQPDDSVAVSGTWQSSSGLRGTWSGGNNGGPEFEVIIDSGVRVASSNAGVVFDPYYAVFFHVLYNGSRTLPELELRGDLPPFGPLLANPRSREKTVKNVRPRSSISGGFAFSPAIDEDVTLTITGSDFRAGTGFRASGPLRLSCGFFGMDACKQLTMR